MKTLTASQTSRLDKAVTRVDDLLAERPPVIADETALTAIINTFDMVVELLAAGQTIYVSVTNEAGDSVALAQLAIEPVAR